MTKPLAKRIFVCAFVLLMCLNICFPVLAEEPGAAITTADALRYAIAGANPGDTIEIGGNIILSGGAITIENEITIQSAESGAFVLTQEGAEIRHFIVASTGKLTLKNVVLDGQKNGENVGGGIESQGELILDQGAVIKNCKANYGGAVNSSRNFTMKQGAEINNCEADNYGGAVYISDGRFIMEGGVISESTTKVDGGGICVWGGAFVMKGGIVSKNHADDSGGGIYIYGETTTFKMEGGAVTKNTAAKEGGGLAVLTKASAEITDGSFTDNKAGARGGGIFNDDGAKITIYNLLVKDNEAKFDPGYDPEPFEDPIVVSGGGIWVCDDGSALFGELSGAAIFDNVSEESGQDAYLQVRSATTVSLSHMILGGGLVRWLDETDNSHVIELLELKREIGLTADVTAAGKTKAEAAAKVTVTGNQAQQGGGLAVNGAVVLGSPAPKSVELSVEKKWEGGQPKYRPEFITVYLIVNGEKQADKFIRLNAANEWKGSFKDLPFADAFGVPIIYAILEEIPHGYVAEYGEIRFNEEEGRYEIIIKNTRTALVNLAVEKVWEGTEPEEVLPEYILVYLVANGIKQDDFVKLDKSNGWKGTFIELDRDENDVPIAYTVVEEVPDGFIASYSELRLNANGHYEITITNTRTERVDLMVEKVWKGTGQEEKLPDFILVYLVINGIKQDQMMIKLEESNGWKGAFTDLEVNDQNGNLIVYTVVEEVPKGFRVDYSELRVDEGKYIIVITNEKTPKTGDYPSVWFAVLGLSALGLCGATLFGRRRTKGDSV